MATQIDQEQQQQRILIEHLRSTGYEGREAWIAALDKALGERVVAIRQFEACATMPACAWRDEADDEIGLWGLLRECMLDLLLSFARIVEATLPADAAQPLDGSRKQTLASRAWRVVRQCLQRIEHADTVQSSYGECVVPFLIAVMLLRQIVEHDVLDGREVADVGFVPYSTNVYEGFLDFLLTKLGRNPVDLLGNATLGQLCGSLEKSQFAAEVQNSMRH